MSGYTRDRGRGHCADGDHVRDGDVLQGPGHGYVLRAAALAQANENGRPNIGHPNIRNHDVLEAAPIHRSERDTGAQVALPRVRPPGDGAIAEDNVLEMAGRFGAEFESIVNGGEMAVGHLHVLRRAADAKGEARLEYNRVVLRLDQAVANAHILAAVRIYPIGVSVPDGDAQDIHAVAAKETDVVVRRVGDGQVMNPDIPTPFQGDRLGAFTSRPVTIDLPWPENAEIGQVVPLEKGEAEVAGFRVRKRVIAEAFDRIEIRVILAGDQGRAGVESQGDVTAEVKGAGEVLAGRKGDCSPRLPGRVNGGLDRAGVDRAAVALCPMVADIEFGANLGGP